jgi:hypothetical protein
MKRATLPEHYRIKILAAAVILTQALWSMPLLGSEPGSTSAVDGTDSFPRHGFYFSFLVGLNKTHQPTIQNRLKDFQFGNTELEGGIPFMFLLGYKRSSDRFELELSFAENQLNDFLDDSHEFYINETRMLFWYRRELRFRMGSTSASLLPGVGIGYASGAAVMGCTADYCQYESNGEEYNYESKVLEASAVTFGIGMRFDALLTSWHGGGGVSFIDISLDYSYRFDDMSPKTIDEGSFFFPTPVEFTVTGHYIALGLQYGFSKW